MSLTKSVKAKPLKVGFDLDGVILYNPIRIFRPLITAFKRDLLNIKKTQFKIPQTRFEKTVFTLLHKTSLFIAPGYNDLIELAKAKQIEAYLITGRFSFLKKDLQKWLKQMNAEKYFQQWHFNQKDEQPHLYKAKLIKSLDLDYFVEDNWDIVQHLNTLRNHNQLKTNVIWIYNLFDRHINYSPKFPYLKKAVDYLKRLP